MNLKIFLLALISFSQLAFAESISGKLVTGGGTDDMRLGVRTAEGNTIDAHCFDTCGDWFIEKGDGSPLFILKKHLLGKKVSMEYAIEPNNDRIAGPGKDEPVLIIKKVRFVH